MIRRRAFLGGLALIAAPAIVRAQARGPRDPFTLGVASGYPTPDGMVLWTRLAPEPLTGGGMGAAPVEVAWELAADEGFRQIITSGRSSALAADAHSVHVEPRGLRPDRTYWYRFHAMGVTSPVARTRTAPALGAALARFRFAYASCQQYEQGYYVAYRHMAARAPDLVIHLGDYIYEGSWGRNLVRSHNAPTAVDLAGYRNRHALYKTDPDLQAAHAAAPWIFTWDDHEVTDDYAADRSPHEDNPAIFLRRRAAAYRAYWEHMPLPQRMRPNGPNLRIHDRVSVGDLVQFHILDDRQYRDYHACPPSGRVGSNMLEDCAARLDPNRTMLGRAQEAWADEGFARSRARWNVIAQQTLMAKLDRRPGPGERYWTDGWDGYVAARGRLLRSMVTRRLANPVVIGGDVHSFWVGDIKLDFDDPRSPTMASEICGGSITSNGPPQRATDGHLAENPHMRLGNSEKRGYVEIELTRARADATLWVVDDAHLQNSGISTLARFAVEDGRPGPQAA